MATLNDQDSMKSARMEELPVSSAPAPSLATAGSLRAAVLLSLEWEPS